MLPYRLFPAGCAPPARWLPGHDGRGVRARVPVITQFAAGWGMGANLPSCSRACARLRCSDPPAARAGPAGDHLYRTGFRPVFMICGPGPGVGRAGCLAAWCRPDCALRPMSGRAVTGPGRAGARRVSSHRWTTAMPAAAAPEEQVRRSGGAPRTAIRELARVLAVAGLSRFRRVMAAMPRARTSRRLRAGDCWPPGLAAAGAAGRRGRCRRSTAAVPRADAGLTDPWPMRQ